MKFRIVKKSDGLYYVQGKKLFFWADEWSVGWEKIQDAKIRMNDLIKAYKILTIVEVVEEVEC